MKNQKWLIFFITLVLIAGAAGVLARIKSGKKLGQPGVKAAPIPGSVAVKINLPERVLDFTSTNVPEAQIVLNYLPKDTSYAERCYENAGGPPIFNTVILMGTDRTSIHRPEYCLPGQGWSIDGKTNVTISIAGASRQLPVTKWVISNSVQTADGQKAEVRGIYVYWFVADNEQTPNQYQMMRWLARDMLFTGVLQRWACVSYFSICAPGQEDAAFERMKQLIAAAVPEFQPPHHGR